MEENRETLNSFGKHIPDEIRKNNNNLNKLLKVLDGMLKVRKDELFNYTRNFLYPLVSDIRIMRRYVDEWRAEYTEESNRLCLDCLYRKYFDIYSRKGTEQGLIYLLTCLFWVDDEPTITIDEYVGGKPLILFDDDAPYDVLPNGQDIANEVLATAGNEVWCPTLLDDTWVHCYTSITITIDIPYTPTPEFIEFIKSVIVLYLPMVSPDFTVINLNFI